LCSNSVDLHSGSEFDTPHTTTITTRSFATSSGTQDVDVSFCHGSRALAPFAVVGLELLVASRFTSLRDFDVHFATTREICGDAPAAVHPDSALGEHTIGEISFCIVIIFDSIAICRAMVWP